jgi:hypothetical protein
LAAAAAAAATPAPGPAAEGQPCPARIDSAAGARSHSPRQGLGCQTAPSRASPAGPRRLSTSAWKASAPGAAAHAMSVQTCTTVDGRGRMENIE